MEFTTTMEETTKALELFNLELPDSNQDLSGQDLRRNPDAFTCFPRLPPELRLKIWKYSFPGKRNLTIHAYFSWCRKTGKPVWRGQTRDATALPPVLHVNRESRFETLKSHNVWVQDTTNLWKCTDPKQQRLFYFDTRTDCLYLSAADLCDIVFDLSTLPIHSALDPKIEFLATVRILELRHSVFDCGMRDWLLGVGRLGSRGGLLGRFPGLKQLHLTSYETRADLLGYRPFFKLIEVEFEMTRKNYPGYEVPEVFYHRSRRRQYRTESEQRNEGRVLWGKHRTMESHGFGGGKLWMKKYKGLPSIAL